MTDVTTAAAVDAFHPIQFQLLSDLHLEFPGPDTPDQYTTFKIPPKAPYLLLAGDIGLFLHEPAFKAFLKAHIPLFTAIFLIPGNHEYYRLDSYDSGVEIGRRLEIELGSDGRFFVLDRKRVDLPGGVSLLGCTLHSYVPREKRLYVERMNDFRVIGGWGIDEHNKAHKEDVEFLKRELRDIKRTFGESQRVVLVTHHAPTYSRTSPPEYHDSPITSGFATELLDGGVNSGGEVPFKKWEGNELVKTWCFGHTHFCTDWVWEGRVRVLANQRGYVMRGKEEREGFDVEFTFEV